MTNPTNRELKIMLDNLHEKVDKVLVQTEKTNGRVTTIETWIWKLTGAVAVLTFFIGIIGWEKLNSLFK